MPLWEELRLRALEECAGLRMAPLRSRRLQRPPSPFILQKKEHKLNQELGPGPRTLLLLFVLPKLLLGARDMPDPELSGHTMMGGGGGGRGGLEIEWERQRPGQ